MMFKEPRRRLVIHELTLDKFFATPACIQYRFFAPSDKADFRGVDPVFTVLEWLYGEGKTGPYALPGQNDQQFTREWRSFPLIERWPWPFTKKEFHHIHSWYTPHFEPDVSLLDLTDVSTPRLRHRAYRELITIRGLVVSSAVRRDVEAYEGEARARYG
jgi:hypothetical protein